MDPTIHMSLRAWWWLARSTRIFGGLTYPVPVALACCQGIAAVPSYLLREGEMITLDHVIAYVNRLTAEAKTKKVPIVFTPLDDSLSCGVGDVRALYVGTPQTIVARPSERDYEWSVRPINVPTCSMCRVTMDRALANCPDKFGDYPTTVFQGRLDKWTSRQPQPSR